MISNRPSRTGFDSSSVSCRRPRSPLMLTALCAHRCPQEPTSGRCLRFLQGSWSAIRAPSTGSPGPRGPGNGRFISGSDSVITQHVCWSSSVLWLFVSTAFWEMKFWGFGRVMQKKPTWPAHVCPTPAWTSSPETTLDWSNSLTFRAQRSLYVSYHRWSCSDICHKIWMKTTFILKTFIFKVKNNRKRKIPA